MTGTGSYLPEKLLTNADLEKCVQTTDEWIVERTGIRTRHIAADHETTSDLCLKASLKALQVAQLEAKDLDMILVATISGDKLMPSTACILQEKLKARNVFAFDLQAACTGFIYGMAIADQFIRTGMYKNILVVGAEILSRFVNYKDRETCILFGDGAGAAIFSCTPPSDSSEIFSSHLAADGSLHELLELQAGGASFPLTEKVLKENRHHIKMNGREIFKHAVRTMSQRANEAIEANNLDISDVDWIVPHQANTRIIDAIAHKVKVPQEKIILNIDHTGNTSAGTIPIAFDEAICDGRIQRGHIILFTAFGAGLTSGSTLMRY